MTDNGAQPQPPPFPSLAKINCIECKGEFIARIPIPRIINGPDFTTIMFVHPIPDKCPNCGMNYIFLVHHIDHNGQLGLQWAPLKPEQPAIVPGTDRNLTQALQNDDIAKKIKLQ